MIDICNDKPIDLYDLRDAKKFQNYFLKINKISTGKRNQSNVQNIFSVMFDKYSVDKKIFSDLDGHIINKQLLNNLLLLMN